MMMDPEAASVLEQNTLLRAALATSQADVTRLAAELAESVRALAVSQGEAESLGEELAHAEKCAGIWWGNWHALRGDLERARGLLGMWDECSRSGLQLMQLRRDTRAFLTPSASPEPDRVSPEVTVKENETP